MILKHIVEYVNNAPDMFFLGKTLGKQVLDVSGIGFAERYPNTGKKKGFRNDAEMISRVIFFGHPKGVYVFIRIELVPNLDAVIGKGKIDKTRIFFQKKIPDDTDKNERYRNNRISCEKGIQNDTSQKNRGNKIPQNAFFFLFVFFGLPMKECFRRHKKKILVFVGSILQSKSLCKNTKTKKSGTGTRLGWDCRQSLFDQIFTKFESFFDVYPLDSGG